jgi:hypothetical protein
MSKSILVYSLNTHSRHSLALCVPTCAIVLSGYIDGLTVAAIIYYAL